MSRRISMRIVGLVWLAGLCLAGGCSKKIWIVQYPQWYTPEYKAIAIVPFKSRTESGLSGQALSDELTAKLTENATYRVFDREHFATLLAERDRQLAMGGDPVKIAQAFSRSGQVQAVLVGTVTTSHYGTTFQERRVKRFIAHDKRGNPYETRPPVWWTYVRNEATVVANAQLYRVPSGSPISGAGASGITGKFVSESTEPTAYAASKPPVAARDCLIMAQRQVVHRLLERFAVVRKQITIKPKEAFKVAKGYYDGEWKEANSFGPSGNMFVAVKMPPVADRNRFKIAIAPRNAEINVVEKELVWSSQWSETGKGVEFDVAEIVRKSGPGAYVAKLYSGPKPVLTKDFKIE